MDRIKQTISNLKDRFNQIKSGRVAVGSMLFLEVVIAFSFIPVVVTVGMLLAVIYLHLTDEWAFRVIDTSIKVIDHIWPAQLVAGVLAYAQKLKDTDNDGIPDDFEK